MLKSLLKKKFSKQPELCVDFICQLKDQYSSMCSY